jgi:D-alanine-D-alanine ligase
MRRLSRRYSRIGSPEQFGKVAVLLGGSSSERDISLLTGEAVHQALVRRGVDAHRLDPAHGFPASLMQGSFDRVWIALHGPGGEDGTIQGLLRYLGLPFTGSGVLGSALCLDKLRTKRVLEGMGLPTAPYRVLAAEDDFTAALQELGLPLIVKPAREGSSIGMTKVERAEDLALAFAAAARFGGEVFAERWIAGDEFTAAVLHDRVLPLIRIEAQAVFYDYQAKYFSDATRYHCPTGLPAETEQRYADIAAQAFEALGAEGWGRVDFMVGRDGAPQILEVNTIPGMTSHSLVPMAARAAGIDFDELVWRVLETSFDGRAIAGEPGGGHGVA